MTRAAPRRLGRRAETGPERQRRRVSHAARERFGGRPELTYRRGVWIVAVDHGDFGGMREYVARADRDSVCFDGR